MNPEKKQKIEKKSEDYRKESHHAGGSQIRNWAGCFYAMKSSDPKVQHFWNSFPCEGDSPTVEGSHRLSCRKTVKRDGNVAGHYLLK